MGFSILVAWAVGQVGIPVANASPDVKPARRPGTFFLLELDSGVAESAYAGALPGLQWGVSAGVTFKLPRGPLRWYLLGSFAMRYSEADAFRGAARVRAEREDIDLFIANRLVMPVWRGLRLYGEVGVGTRIVRERVERTEGLGALSSLSDRLLWVTAVGVQLRMNRHWSVGLRGELTPLAEDLSLGSTAGALPLEPRRLSFEAQIGLHF